MKLAFLLALSLLLVLSEGKKFEQFRTLREGPDGETTDPLDNDNLAINAKLATLWNGITITQSDVLTSLPQAETAIVKAEEHLTTTTSFRQILQARLTSNAHAHTHTMYPPSANQRAIKLDDRKKPDILAGEALGMIAACSAFTVGGFSAAEYLADAKAFLTKIADGSTPLTPFNHLRTYTYCCEAAVVYGLALEYEVIADLASGKLTTSTKSGQKGLHVFNEGIPDPLVRLRGDYSGAKWFNYARGANIEGYDMNKYNFNGQYFRDCKNLLSKFPEIIEASQKTDTPITKEEAAELLTDHLTILSLASFDTIGYYLFKTGKVSGGGDPSNAGTVGNWLDAMIDTCPAWGNAWANHLFKD